jgi:hypothetical protein
MSRANATVGAAYTGQTLAGSATDPNGDPLTYSAIAGPEWLSIATSGVLSGTPGSADVGNNSWLAQVSDGLGGTDSATLNITVSAGASGSVTLNPTDDTWVTVSSPTSNKGADGALRVASAAQRESFLKFTVSGISQSINSATLRLYSVSVAQTVNCRSVADTSWTETSVTYNNRPAMGNVVDSQTAVAGTWTEYDVTSYVSGNGTYAFGLEGTGGIQDFSSKEGANPPELVINYGGGGGNTAPAFTADPMSKANATEDVAYTGQTLAGSATDPDAGATLTYTKVSGPSWLGIALDGTLSGTPANSDVGTVPATVQVSDGLGGTDTAVLNITVINVNDAPVFTVDPMSRTNATAGSAYTGQTLSGSATDVDAGASLTYTTVSGPTWLSIATSGALSGTPASTNVGANSWTVQVSDGLGGTDTAVLNITVNADPTSPPSFVAAGAVASGTGTIAPALPAGIATGDILLLFVETANQASSISAANGGTWTEITAAQGTGTAGGTSAARLTAFWSRYNGTQGAPTVADSGDHQIARMIAVRGAASSGNPWDVAVGGVEATSDTSGSIPGATTTVANTLVVVAVAGSLPDSNGTANFSAWANANLTSLTERTDNTSNSGNGGSLGVATGVKATAGAYGATTVTHASAAVKGMMSIAIKK